MNYKVLISIALLTSLFGCDFIDELPLNRTFEENVRIEAKKRFKYAMHDADSYELVSLYLVDSISPLNNLQKLKINLKADSTDNSDKLEANLKNGTYRHYLKYEINQAQKLKGLYSEVLNRLDSIQSINSDSLKSISYYVFEHTSRGANLFGAKVLNTHFLQVVRFPNNGAYILEMNKEEPSFLTKNDFYGYNEVIKPLVEDIEAKKNSPRQ